MKNPLTSTIVTIKFAAFWLLLAAGLLLPALAPAATLTWDPGKTGTGSDSGGSTTWSTASTIVNWSNGSSDVAWANGDDASIGAGGTASNIKVYGATVGNITFNSESSGGYNVSGANTLTFTGGTVTVNNTAAATAFKSLIIGGSVGFTKAGSGTLIFTDIGTPNFTGTLKVNAGTLQMSTAGITINNTFEVDQNGTFDINKTDDTVGALTDGGGTGGTIINSGGSSHTLTIGNGDGSGSFSGAISPTTTSTIALTKTGAGTQILSGTSTYTGATKVNAGTLLVNGSIAGAVTNASGAYFGGYGGTVGGKVTYQSGSFALFTNGTPMTFNGGLTLNGNPVVHLNLPASLPDGSYTLANYSGTLTGTFATTPVVDSGSYADGSAVPAITTGSGTVTLNLGACEDASITSDLPASTTAFIGGQASFTVGATGSSLTYDWQKNTGSGFADVIDGTGQGTPTYTTPTLTGAETGWEYQCIVSASCGSPQTSSASTLTVTDPSVYSFQTVQSGNWNDPNTWNQSTDGVNWGPTAATPSYLNSNITVQAGHKVTVTANVAIDDTVIQAGGEVDVSGVTLTINHDASGPVTGDLDVSGTLVVTTTAGSAVAESGSPTVTFESGSVFSLGIVGGAVPAATWDPASTCTYAPTAAGATIPTGLSQTFGNFVWNWPTQNGSAILGGALTTVAGDFEITSGAQFCFGPKPDNSGTVETLTVGGAIKVHTVSGNFLLGSGGTEAGTYTVRTGNGIIVDGGGKLDMGNPHGGAGSMTVEFTGDSQFTLGVAMANPAAASYIVDDGATLALNNGIAVSVGRTFTVNGTLEFNTSQITGAGTLTVNSTGVLVGNGESQLTTGLGSIAYNGTLNLPGLPTFAGGESFVLFGATSYSGSFTSIIPATPGAGLTWDTSQLTTSGTLAVTSGGGPVVQITGITFDGANININGSAGVANAFASFSVVTNGDFSIPVASWSVQGTGACDENGDFTYSVPMDTGTSVLFYDVHVP